MSYKFNPFTGNFDDVGSNTPTPPYDPPITTTIYVDCNRVDSYIETGTIQYPYKSLQVAIDSTSTYPVLFILAPGTYVEDISVVDKQNILIKGASGPDSALVTIDGTFQILNNSTRIRLQDIRVNGLFTINSTQGRHTFTNVTFNSGLYVQSSNNWNVFKDIFVSGSLTLAAPNTVTYIHGQKSTSCDLELSSSTSRCYVDSASKFNKILHSDGSLFLDGITSIEDEIISTADSGYLSIQNVNLQKDDGSYVNINKTGTCSYVLGQVNRDPLIDILTGTRDEYSQRAVDIGYDNSTSGLTATDVQDAIDELATSSISTQTKIEHITLIQNDIDNQFITLLETPISAQDVALDVIGGGPQFLTDDFSVVGNQIHFEGNLATGGLSALVAGDKLRIIYTY